MVKKILAMFKNFEHMFFFKFFSFLVFLHHIQIFWTCPKIEQKENYLDQYATIRQISNPSATRKNRIIRGPASLHKQAGSLARPGVDLSLSSDRRRRWRASRCVRDYIARGFGLCSAAEKHVPSA